MDDDKGRACSFESETGEADSERSHRPVLIFQLIRLRPLGNPTSRELLCESNLAGR
jgi:hypothetical protein